MNNKTCSDQAVATSGAITEINRLHAEICQSARTTIEKAIRIGELLTEQKEALKHGEWLPWLEANVQFDRTTAFRYMRVFERRAELECCSVQHLTEAYRLLASDKDESDTLAGTDVGTFQTHAPDYDFDAMWEQIQFRLWKLERAWKEVESKQDISLQNMKQIVEVIHEGQALKTLASEYTIRCERELGRALKERDEKLKHFEAVVGFGFEEACHVAAAITEIRVNHLYRDTYSSFAEYCSGKLGCTESRVNEWLSAFSLSEVFAETGGAL